MRRINLYITAFLLLILVVYLAFLDTLAKPVFERLATEQYGAEVSIDRLSLQPFMGRATLFELQVVDRRNAMQNLVQADRVYVDIDMIKLAESVIDVSDMEIDGLLAFAPRETAGVVLRPLVEDDSPLAKIGLPDFEIPDVDRLIDRKRDELEAEIRSLEASFDEVESKWKDKIDSIPDEDDIKAYKERIRKLRNVDNPLQAITAVQEAQTVYNEVNAEITRISNFQNDFRGDMAMLQEQIALATKLPEKYTNALVRDLGLDSEQMAQLGRQVMRGDLDGLMQQVLAPLAFNDSGEASTQEDAMPIFVRRAAINGSLLPSALGLMVDGELTDFAWPLENADDVARLLVSGSAAGGGELSIDANVDHRGTPADRIIVNAANLPFKDMQLSGTKGLSILMAQTLASISGELTVNGGELDGSFTNRFTDTVFDTSLEEGAGQAAQLIARVLQSSSEFMMQVGFDGTLQNPQVNFASDMDQIFQSTIEGAISAAVTELTDNLNQQLSSTIGPRVSTARENFGALEALQADLRKKMADLNQLSKS